MVIVKNIAKPGNITNHHASNSWRPKLSKFPQVTTSSGTTLSAITRDLESRHGGSPPDHQIGTTIRLAVLAEHMADINDRVDTHAALSTHLTLIDEDNMASNSATQPPSQQSVKAYVDAQNAAQAVGASLGLVIALS